MKLTTALSIISVTLSLPFVSLGAEKSIGQSPPKAVVFVQNRAGSELDAQVEPLANELTARLTEKGFSIIDRKDVMATFSENRGRDKTNLAALKAVEQLLATGKSDTRLDDALSGGSALRIAQMLQVNYLVMATINSLGTEIRTFKGEGTAYNTNNQTTLFNLKLTVKVLEGGQGSSVYGDVVTASERIAVGENLTISTNDIHPRLIEAAAIKVADNIAGKIEAIRNVKVVLPLGVGFTVKSNVKGANVELDGVVIGSTPGKFKASPGIHQLRVTKELLTNWERTVNIVPNQTFTVTLELSDEGIRQYTTLERFKTEMEVAKKHAEGEKKMLEKSYIRYQGAPTTNIIH
jgi:PEGA domain